jgi:hypothetical protein
MTQQINSFRELIELWPSREGMAADIGAKSSAVSKWWQRDSVPAEWWAPILSTDVAVKSRLRPEALIELAARTPSEVTT